MDQVNPALVILRVTGSGQIGPAAARGLLAAPEVAAVSGVGHLSMGGVDLLKDLGTDGGNLQMPYTRSRIVAAPRRRSTASTRASTTSWGCAIRPSPPARSASPASPRSIHSNSTPSTTCSPHPRRSSPGRKPSSARSARSPPPEATRSGSRDGEFVDLPVADRARRLLELAGRHPADAGEPGQHVSG
jgi:citrate lyase subunit beta/citryl-CoA lyase